MSEKQVVQAMDHCVQAMEAYIKQTKDDNMSSDDTVKWCVEYVDEMRKKQLEFVEKIRGVTGCPNKWNKWHECNSWCQEHYGDGKKKELDPEYPEKSTRVSCDSNLVDGTILWGDARRWKTIGDHEVV